MLDQLEIDLVCYIIFVHFYFTYMDVLHAWVSLAPPPCLMSMDTTTDQEPPCESWEQNPDLLQRASSLYYWALSS